MQSHFTKELISFQTMFGIAQKNLELLIGEQYGEI